MQQTPTGHKIPVPRKDDVLDFFRKASRATEPPSEPPSDDGDAGSPEEQE